MNSINFEQDKTDILDKSENIKSLSNEVQKMESLSKEIEDIEENLKKKKKDLDVISGEVIPTMMSEMGLSQLKLMDGSQIDVKPFYNATITVANRESAFNWLRQNGLGDIIKNEVVVSFGRGEDNKAAEYAELAKSQGLQPAQKLKVEPMTLKALVRQRIEAGQEMPTEIFSIFVGNKTTIKRKK
jgi:pyruvate carboxylase